MDQAVTQAADLLTDMSNEEYIRGMCELLARLYPEPGVCTCDRADQIRSLIAARIK